MNRVHCNACDEVALESPLLAEQLEGLGLNCSHCGAFGLIGLRDNDEGGIGRIELVADLPCEETP